jgi:cyanophycin synthetase
MAVLHTMFYLDPIEYASVLPVDSDTKVVLVWATQDPKMSRLSLEVAVRGFAELLRDNAEQPAGENYRDSFSRLIQRAARRRLSGSTTVLRTAALRLEIPFELITRRQLLFGQGVRQQQCFSTMTASTSFSAAKMALDKRQSNRKLDQLSLPVPRQASVNDVAEAIAALRRIGGQAVVKPARGNHGRGITVGVKTAADMAAAFQRADAEGTGVLIEELVLGNDYRLTIVGGKLAATLLCIPPQIRGDGVRTIRQLVEELNCEWDRAKQLLSPVAIDDELEALLRESGCTLDTIPTLGAAIAIRRTGHVSRGGIPIDVTDLVHPDNQKVSEDAARAIGLDIAGVDFISPDISRSYRETGGWIVEVNSRPAIDMHLWPREGTPRDLGTTILNSIYRNPAAACIPLLLIAGDRGCDFVARLVESMLTAKGLSVGLRLTRGAYINGHPLDVSADRLEQAPSILLRSPSVEAVAATVSLSRIRTHGLGLERCTGVSLVSAGQERNADQFAKELSVLMKANPGRFIVDVKNRLARQILSPLDPSRVVLVAADANNPELREHIAARGAAVVKSWSEDGTGANLTLVDAGMEVESANLPSLYSAKLRHTEAAMHAFALTHFAFSYL